MAARDVGAELGVFKGSFIDYMLATKPKKLYLVDPWYRISREWRWAAGDKSPVRALINIITEFEDEIESGILEPRIQFSSEFLLTLPDDSLDWVYIDTNHTYETTIIELDLSMKKVKLGGYIMGDDYYSDPKHVFHGVYAAVKEFEAAGKLKIVVDGTHYQFVARRQY